MCRIFPRSQGSFQSTPPVWGATLSRIIIRPLQNFNPRPPCGGRRGRYLFHPQCHCISIHAPRVGGDLIFCHKEGAQHISIHAPRVGGDRAPERFRLRYGYFNPRPPCGGRPGNPGGAAPAVRDFNPRPPCGGRRQKQLKIQAVLVKNRQFLQISSSNSYPILKNKVASLQIILQNLVRDLGDFLRAYVSHLKHQYIFWVVGCLYSKMLDLVFIAVSQVIKTKTVLFRVHDLTQLCL